MKRWNGWGDDDNDLDYQLNASALDFLEGLIGTAAPLPDASLEQVLARAPVFTPLTSFAAAAVTMKPMPGGRNSKQLEQKPLSDMVVPSVISMGLAEITPGTWSRKRVSSALRPCRGW